MINNYELLLTFIVGIIIFGILVAFIISFVFLFQKRQAKHREEKQALKIAYEQEILTSQLEVQNQTLQEISQELHDNIGQLLSVARMNLNVMEEEMPDNDGYIKQTNEIIHQSIKDLRALTKSLDIDFVQQFGLEESLSYEIERIRKTKRFATEINIIGEKNSLGYEREIVLFRVSQEILNNALKHSKAKNLSILLSYLPDSFELCIKDDGQGFDIEAIQQKEISQSGAGLRNIQRRVKLIGGTCSITSEIGIQTQIKITLSH
ncbi:MULTISPECIES: ATP-binding protein [unclassified Arcicella]|uniref:sensor histidine kinase n=1 Tax=unclassified Arcicella TaxID=2644986 RepID=UPI00285C762D|nr:MULTISPECIES: ATP-binding protein [unclassified Arcicella]MDR6559957.1 signal transduction histidine kinase [Arcicella sp. BE51]MDR6810436.1 signal transduction histidine kinase [Arcicella sp. BE140]MDR6821786.1 signal transduction histidine kinase [Arcicella sp. BE139]